MPPDRLAKRIYKPTSEIIQRTPMPIETPPPFRAPMTSGTMMDRGATPAGTGRGFWVGRSTVTPGAAEGAGSTHNSDDASALKSLFDELLNAETRKDKAAIAKAGQQLILPSPEAWFTRMYGYTPCAGLTKEYQSVRKMLEDEFPKLIRTLWERGQTRVSVVAVRSPSDAGATPAQKRALEAMSQPTALYTVRFWKPGDKQAFNVYSFVHVDGAFRFAGKMQALGAGSTADTSATVTRGEIKPARSSMAKQPLQQPEVVPGMTPETMRWMPDNGLGPRPTPQVTPEAFMRTTPSISPQVTPMLSPGQRTIPSAYETPLPVAIPR